MTSSGGRPLGFQVRRKTHRRSRLDLPVPSPGPYAESSNSEPWAERNRDHIFPQARFRALVCRRGNEALCLLWGQDGALFSGAVVIGRECMVTQRHYSRKLGTKIS